jgi:thymidylate synthase (FAD)
MADPSVVVPDAIGENPDAQAVWARFMEHVKETYQDLRALGIRKEDARFALPNAAATRIVVTMNFRELRHFFRLRITPEAQWEIRRMALEMLKQVLPYAPTIFGDSLAEIRTLYPELIEDGP